MSTINNSGTSLGSGGNRNGGAGGNGYTNSGSVLNFINTGVLVGGGGGGGGAGSRPGVSGGGGGGGGGNYTTSLNPPSGNGMGGFGGSSGYGGASGGSGGGFGMGGGGGGGGGALSQGISGNNASGSNGGSGGNGAQASGTTGGSGGGGNGTYPNSNTGTGGGGGGNAGGSGGNAGNNVTGSGGSGGGGGGGEFGNGGNGYGSTTVKAGGGGGGGAGGGNGGTSTFSYGGGGGCGGGLGKNGGGNGGVGLRNTGTITNLSNLQNFSSNYGPLYIAGNAPTNYYIIINNSSYGQLYVSPNAGFTLTGSITNFGIDTSSILSIGSNIYSNVFYNVSYTGPITGNFSFNGYIGSWTLSGTTTKNLSVTVVSLATTFYLNSQLINFNNYYAMVYLSSGTTNVSASYTTGGGNIIDLSINNASVTNISNPYNVPLNLTDNSLNFTVNDSARSVSQAYFIAVHVYTPNTFLNNVITLYNRTVTFTSFNASIDVSYGIDDISGSYVLVDPSANVDLSLNNVRQQRGMLSPFDVSGLIVGDNSLNFLVRGYDNLSSQAYFVKVHVQTANTFKSLFLNKTQIDISNTNLRLDISYGIRSISGDYYLTDPIAKVDLSVNLASQYAIGPSFNIVNLLTGDNSLNFTVTASDKKTLKTYPINVYVKTSADFSGNTITLYNRTVTFNGGGNATSSVDVSYGITDISGYYKLVDPSANVDLSVNLVSSYRKIDVSFNVPGLVRGDNSLNFMVKAKDGLTLKPYSVTVHVQTAKDFSGNVITLYNQPVTFDASYNAYLDVSYGISDVSGQYVLLDPSANVDLSVNNVRQQRGMLSPFDVSGLQIGDNSLNFMVNAYDGKTKQPYFVKLHVQTANTFKSLFLNKTQIDISNANLRLDISYGISSISGDYYLTDPIAKVDLSVNNASQYAIGPSFNMINLLTGDNSLNFTVTASDKKTLKTYPINVHVKTSSDFSGNAITLYGRSVNFGLSGIASSFDVSYGISKINGVYVLVDPSANVDLSVNLVSSYRKIDVSFDVPGLVRGDNSLNFMVTAKDGLTQRPYSVMVHVQTAKDFSGNVITLYNQPVFFDASYNAYLDVSYGISDVSGQYVLLDPSANVDLSVNNVRQQRGMLSPFDVSGLQIGDNSLNFMVNAYDGKTKQPYFVKLHVQTSNKFYDNLITLYNQTINFGNGFTSLIYVDTGTTDISGSYTLVDSRANVDLSINGVGVRNIGVSFNVPGLVVGNNDLSFCVKAFDGKTQQIYYVNAFVKSSSQVSIILYDKTILFDNNNRGTVDVSYGISDISGMYLLTDVDARVDLSINGVSYPQSPLLTPFNVPGLVRGDNSLNFMVISSDGLTIQPYFVKVHVQTANKFVGNAISLYKQHVFFDASFNAYLDVSYGVYDVSGGYELVDASANVDLSVNGVGYRNIGVSFDVPLLVSGDNSLNFLVRAWDGQTQQPYFVKLHMQTANSIQTLYLNNRLINLDDVEGLRIDVSNGLSDISGSYYLVDPSAIVDISVNQTYSAYSVDTSFNVPTLVMGDNSLNLTVTAYDGQTFRNYPINVHVQTSVDFSGNLVTLYGQSVVFDLDGVATSQVDVSFGVSDISGGYLLVDPSANVDLSVNGVGYSDISGVFDVPGLVRGDNSLNFLVSAYDGQTSRTYSVNVHVQTANKFVGNAISLYNQPVFFDASFNSYLDISYGVYDVSGGYALVDASANVDLSVNGVGYRNIGVSFDVPLLVMGDNSLNFLVRAWDGQTQQPYFVKLHMQTANSIQTLYLNNRLIDLEVIEGLRIDVSNGLSDISGSYVLVDGRANVDISVNQTYSGYNIGVSFDVPTLVMGDNSLNFLVTAYDGQTFRNYPINVHVQTSVDFSGNLVTLYGQSVVFDLDGVATSQVDISYGIGDICGGYVLVDPSANVDLSVNGVGYSDISGVFDVPGLVRGDNSLNFLVSAYDGQTSRSYAVNVHVQTSSEFSGVTLYGQTVLFGLDGFALGPVDVSNAIRDISGSYNLVDASANVDLSLNGVEIGRDIPAEFDVTGLLVGDNSLNFTVTAWDGQTSHAYVVGVHVQTSVDFSSMVLYGQPIAFDVDGVALGMVYVSYEVRDISGDYVLVDGNAKVDLSLNGVEIGRDIPAAFDVSGLLVGDNSLNFMIRASDGQTAKGYVVGVHVETSDEFSALYLDGELVDVTSGIGRLNVPYGVSVIAGSYTTVDGGCVVDLSVNDVYQGVVDSVFSVGLGLVDNSLNFSVLASDGRNRRGYVVSVHVETSDLFYSLYLDGRWVNVSSGFGSLDVSSGITDISGSYLTVDTGCQVDLSVNGVGIGAIDPSFNVGLGLTDNVLNFLVTSSDELNTEAYVVNVHVKTSALFTSLILDSRVLDVADGYVFSIDVSNDLTSVSGSYALQDTRATVGLRVNGVSRGNIGTSFTVSLVTSVVDYELDFMVRAYDGLTNVTYRVNVHVQASPRFNALYLNRNLVNFDVNYAAVVNIASEIVDLSGSYYTVGAGAYVELDLNGAGMVAIDPSFNVALVQGVDNSLNFLVTASDFLSSQEYSVKVRYAKSVRFASLILNGFSIGFDSSFNAYLEFPYEIYDVVGSYVTEDPYAEVNLLVNDYFNGLIGNDFNVILTPFKNLLTFTITGSDGANSQNYYLNIRMKVACLLEGTRVWTDKGYVPIETLKVGDSIQTEHYFIAITKVGKWSVDLNREEDREDLSKKMYVIPAGKYGATSEVLISRNHRFMFEEGDGGERLMGTPVKVGLRPAELHEFTRDGKYTLYHLEVKYGNHFMVNGGCRVESWTPGKVI